MAGKLTTLADHQFLQCASFVLSEETAVSRRSSSEIIRELTYFGMASDSLETPVGDDARMADTVEQVAARLAQLEMTMAKGFHDIELRFSAMDRKIDINVEALRGDIQTVAETVTALTSEMRRTTDAMRKEHAADREVLRQALLNHAERLHSMENANDNRR